MIFSLISFYTGLHIYTIISGTKNRNLSKLITLDPLDYGIVQIPPKLQKYVAITSLIIFFHTPPPKLVNKCFPFLVLTHLLETLYCLNLWRVYLQVGSQ